MSSNQAMPDAVGADARRAALAAPSPQEGGGGADDVPMSCDCIAQKEVHFYDPDKCCLTMRPGKRGPLPLVAPAATEHRPTPPRAGVQVDREAARGELELVLRHHLPVKTPGGPVLCICDVTETYDGPVGHRLHVADAVLASLAPLLAVAPGRTP